MIPEHLEALAAAEDRHWWFAGRRRIISQVLARRNLSAQTRILDVGCGPGGNLEMLSRFGTVSACEMDEGVRAVAARRGFRVEAGGQLPGELPFAGERFDLVTLLDVLEHTSDDIAALRNVRSRLKDNGSVVITVPAYQWLWSAHDEGSRHFRRYTRSQLAAVMERAGYTEVRAAYFNFWLFPVAVVLKLLNRRAGSKRVPGLAVPPSFINGPLAWLFSSEAVGTEQGWWPWGVSVIAWGRASPPS